MSRVVQIVDKDQIDEEYHGIFDSITSSRGTISGPFSVLLHSPEIAGRAAHLGEYVRFKSGLSDDEREIAILTAARELDCRYEWGAHEPIARASGVSDSTISTIALRGNISNIVTSDEIIISYVRQLIGDHRVSPKLFNRALNLLGLTGLTELTATAGYYVMLACALNAFDVEPTHDMPVLPDTPFD